LLAHELIADGYIRPTREFGRFRQQLQRLTPEDFPEDRRFNPLAINPYVLFRAAQQAQNFEREELTRAMELFLRCNQDLILSQLDEAMILQRTLVEICRWPTTESLHGQP